MICSTDTAPLCKLQCRYGGYAHSVTHMASQQTCFGIRRLNGIATPLPSEVKIDFTDGMPSAVERQGEVPAFYSVLLSCAVEMLLEGVPHPSSGGFLVLIVLLMAFGGFCSWVLAGPNPHNWISCLPRNPTLKRDTPAPAFHFFLLLFSCRKS